MGRIKKIKEERWQIKSCKYLKTKAALNVFEEITGIDVNNNNDAKKKELLDKADELLKKAEELKEKAEEL